MRYFKNYFPLALYLSLFLANLVLNAIFGIDLYTILIIATITFSIYYFIQFIKSLIKKESPLFGLTYLCLLFCIIFIYLKIDFYYYNSYVHFIVIIVTIILILIHSKIINNYLKLNLFKTSLLSFFILNIILFFISDSWILSQLNPDLIPYNKSNQIIWDDFKGKPEYEITDNTKANINYSIMYKLNYVGNSQRIVIGAFMDPKLSWKIAEFDDLLIHEIYHFKITEIHVRKAKARIESYFRNSLPVFKNILIEEKEIEHQMQLDYDSETNHSLNYTLQQSWNYKIDSALKVLSP